MPCDSCYACNSGAFQVFPLFLVHNPAFVVVDLKKNLIIVEYHGRFLACVDNVLKITRIFLNYAQTPK
jgi:hypothetical protein